jgi:hypothetical protein
MIKVRNRLLGAAVACSLVGIFSTAAFAGFNPTAAQRSDCMSDVMSLCSSAIPSMDRIAACLTSKKSQLSPTCRAYFEKK